VLPNFIETGTRYDGELFKVLSAAYQETTQPEMLTQDGALKLLFPRVQVGKYPQFEVSTALIVKL